MTDFDNLPKSNETSSQRARRTMSRRPKNSQKSNSIIPPLNLLSDPPDPPSVPFRHINANEQIRGGSSSGSGLYFKDLFTVTDPLNKEFNLTFAPIKNSEIVSWNGQVLRSGVTNDYIVVVNPTNQVQFSGYIVLNIGDLIMVSYNYLG